MGVAGREKAARARLAPSRGVPSNQTIETSGKRLLKRSNPAVGGGSSLRAPPAPSSGVTGWTERKRSVVRPKKVVWQAAYVRSFLRQPFQRSNPAVGRRPRSARPASSPAEYPPIGPWRTSPARKNPHPQARNPVFARQRINGTTARTCTLPTRCGGPVCLSVSGARPACERRAAAAGWQVPAEPTMPRLNSPVLGRKKEKRLNLGRPLEMPPWEGYLST